MVQIRKEIVRDKIVLAAEALFAQAGFRKSTVEAIAKKAGIATGNIYTYYPNKRALFKAVITPEFVEEFSLLTRNRIAEFEQPQGIDPSLSYSEGEAGKLLHFWIKNRSKVVILLARSEGTEYEDFGQQYVQDMTAQAIAQIRKQYPGLEITALLQFMLEKALTDSVRGIVSILEHFEDESAILEAFGAGTAYHLGGITALVEWASRQKRAI
ncbi:TetR/AcrR family transcriptional regulator [Desulfovibrio inopinatus]|uniref:TetR/AcrR family transcriptional regulator n=1 Tax=Desulfovibrio inopinatus TaxID=102109 RepID=UPI000406C77E|nr:helix-turn-helix domain-containing protein [Desulfovibrio inopinatus]